MNEATHLATIRARQQQMAEARDRFVDAIREAIAAGVPQHRIAEVTRLSRTTLWRKAKGTQ